MLFKNVFNIRRLNCINKLIVPSRRCLVTLNSNFKQINFEHTDSLRYKSFAMKKLFGLVQSSFSTSTTPAIHIAYYDEIEDLPNHPEKLLVDVREPNELQKTGRIPTSINVPLGDVQKAFSNETSPADFAKLYNHSKPNRNDQVILSCQSGRRSEIAAEALIKQGYTEIKSYKGSWRRDGAIYSTQSNKTFSVFKKDAIHRFENNVFAFRTSLRLRLHIRESKR